MRSLSRLLPLILLTTSVACGPETVGSGGEIVDPTIESKKVPAFPPSSYYQIDSAHPSLGQITLLMLNSDGKGGFWGKRCLDSACATTQSLQGSYTNTRTTLTLRDASGSLLGKWAFSLSGGTLTLRAFGMRLRYALDPMSESLCDSSGGAWSDDDSAAHGFNCTCSGELDWGPGGCPSSTCGAGLSSCGGTCVDLQSDPTSCGACNATCTKAQSCIQGACQ